MKNELETIPNADSVERKEDKHKSRIKKPRSIGWWLIGLFVLLGAVLLTGIALKYRTLQTVPPWVTFLSASLLNLFLLAVVIAQAYIYQKQREAMLEQRDAMTQQLNAMKDQVRISDRAVDIAEQTAIYSQRAYLSATVESVHKGFLFYLKIENSGNTPANEVTVSYSSGFSETEPDGLDADFMCHEHIGLIAPKGYHLHHAPYIEPVTPEDKEGYNTGELKFYCWGRITYRDIFRKGRRTWFSFYTSPKLGRLAACPCSRGNEAQ